MKCVEQAAWNTVRNYDIINLTHISGEKMEVMYSTYFLDGRHCFKCFSCMTSFMPFSEMQY